MGYLWFLHFGTIRLMQLDPKTGKRLHEEQSELIVANNSEASDLMYHEGWYYLLTNHGTCCRGADSTYNIRVGRSRKITGPYLDDHDSDMARSGGKLFAAAGERKIGPGHFGLLDLGDGVQKFSCHYEADLDHQGQSVLDIRPLLWRDGWPVAGENLKEGGYQVMSKHAGTVLELAVQGVPAARGRGRGGVGGLRRGGPGAGPASAPASSPAGPIADQTAAQVSRNWPTGDVDVRMSPYLLEAQQKWTIAPVADCGGYPGSAFFKITITGTDRALAATDDDELVSVPSFAGKDEQLWRIDQLADGSYRISPKVARAVEAKLAAYFYRPKCCHALGV